MEAAPPTNLNKVEGSPLLEVERSSLAERGALIFSLEAFLLVNVVNVLD
jgi:hypothetical protein